MMSVSTFLDPATMTYPYTQLELWAREARRTWGSELDLSNIEAVSPEILRHFHGARIEVERTYPDGESWVRRGRVSVTMGWRPSLLLMHRVSDSGSSDLLSSEDRLVKVVSR